MLIRFLAATAIGWALVDLVLYWVVNSHKNLPEETVPCLVKSLPAIVGVVMFIKSKSLAEWMADKLDL